MSISTSFAISTLCEMLRTKTEINLSLNHPSERKSKTIIWPWRIEDISINYRDGNSPDEISTLTSHNIHFIILTKSNLTFEALSQLDDIRKAIIDNPVMNVDGKSVQVNLTTLTVDELTSVFLAAGSPLTVCVSAVLRAVWWLSSINLVALRMGWLHLQSIFSPRRYKVNQTHKMSLGEYPRVFLLQHIKLPHKIKFFQPFLHLPG